MSDKKYTVELSYEPQRKCGSRKPGKDGVGVYLVGDLSNAQDCERLPFPLLVCPTCGGGIHFSRGYTWINPSILFAPNAGYQCIKDMPGHNHLRCPMCNAARVAGTLAGLVWVGEQYYKRPEHFILEALKQGISRKIPALPHGFEIGMFVYLAHVKALLFHDEDAKVQYQAGVFGAYRPNRVDIVVDTDNPNELPERAKAIADRMGNAAHIIKVIPEDSPEGEVVTADDDAE